LTCRPDGWVVVVATTFSRFGWVFCDDLKAVVAVVFFFAVVAVAPLTVVVVAPATLVVVSPVTVVVVVSPATVVVVVSSAVVAVVLFFPPPPHAAATKAKLTAATPRVRAGRAVNGDFNEVPPSVPAIGRFL
jgi:hypothetical protein